MEAKVGNILKNKATPAGGNGTHKKYKVTFLPMNVTVEVDESQFPLQHDGKPGSLLDIALAHGLKMGHNCGGNCACTTCHVVVKQGLENLSPMQQDEEDRLDIAEGLTLSSRLGCQAVVKGDVVAEIMEEGEAGH
jgi:2Fe-2S ferredoxin